MGRPRGPVLVRASIGLTADECAQVRLEPAPGRWPGHAASDRLSLAGGAAALALRGSASEEVRGVVRQAALWTASARITGRPDDGLRWDDPAWGFPVGPAAEGEPAVACTVVELHRSRVGPVPRLARGAGPPLALAVAVPALMLAIAVEQAPEERTAAALVLEGVLGWDRHDAGLQPAQQAVAYALRYAAARLEEAGRPAPPALREAIAAQRTVTPMAGGA
jgi:hypothetical protein